jgi:hypothetical protein
MKLPGIASAGQGLIGDIGGAATGGIKSLQGGIGGAHAKQENSDLSKVVEDLLHDKLMGKMGGAAGASSPFGAQQAPTLGGLQMPKSGGPAANSFGGLQLPKFGGDHGPVVHGGQQSPLQGAQQENGDLKKLLSDLLQQRSSGTQGQPQALGGQGGENDDLMKLLSDLLKGGGGAQGAGANPFGAQQAGGQQPAAGSLIQPQAGGLGGQNDDLMKLIEDLLKDKSSAGGAGASGASGDSGNPMHLLQQEGEQLKGLQSMMQQTA